MHEGQRDGHGPDEPRKHDDTAASGDGQLDRRRFLQVSGATMAAVGGGLTLAGTASAESRAAKTLAPKPGQGSSPKVAVPGSGVSPTIAESLVTTPVRPPAAPLIVRSPYLSTWQASTVAAGTWETFWNGDVTALAGIARIDGASYMFLGSPTIMLDVPDGGYIPPGGSQEVISDFQAALDQTQLTVTATRSIYTLQGAGVQLTVTFLSPVEPGDLQRQSIPMAYVFVTAQSIDGSTHDVSVYLDISGEWLSGDPSSQFTWAYSTANSLSTWSLQLADQQPLVDQNDRAPWGTIVWSTPQTVGLSYQSGSSPTVRAQFVDNGALTNTNDTSFTTINGDGYPVFAFALDLGQVGSSAHTQQFTLGQVRTPLVSFLGKPLAPLWTRYWSSWQSMLAFFQGDSGGARLRSEALDAKITADAQGAGGVEYEGLCVLALRQAYGATELAIGPDGTPWGFLKEISSGGDTNTVDVLYPASPVWIYLDPVYLSLLLKPIFGYVASGQWTAPYSPHDLGHYPNATGYPGNGGENMPVEESGNMIIMCAAYSQAAPGAASQAYLKANYAYLKQWANYLVSVLPDPGFQNQTDDFAGYIAHSVNLAVKGIIALAAMGQIATTLGQSADATYFTGKAQTYIKYWITHAQDPSGKHLDLTYNGSDDGNGTWGTTYNCFADSLLGTDLVPASIAAEQASFYPTVTNMFGTPLQVPHSYAKSDWEMFTAAWLNQYPIARELIDREYLYANTTSSRVPFSDLYSTISGDQVGFQARPVQGGLFALLALQTLQNQRNPQVRRARSRRDHRQARRAHHAGSSR